MPQPSFERLEELFHRATELPDADVTAFLDRECAGQPELRKALEEMLRHDRRDTTEDGPLVSPVGDVASKLRHEAPTMLAAPGSTPASSATPQIPGYEIMEVLGRGGMGVVYKARQVGLNRLVALKMLPLAVPTSEQLGRFRNEAEALARLNHPNVVRIYEVGETSIGPFFSMEYVTGPNLSAYLDGRPCEAASAARLVQLIAGAIDAVHQRGIVHRDLKPGNVLLAPRRDPSNAETPAAAARLTLGDYEPKITDFGLAKSQTQVRALTRTGTTLGTPCYMAPEQAYGRGKLVGPLADIYSLGAILYEMLTGRPPFEDVSPLVTMARLVRDDPPHPSQLRPGLPRDLITICLKCLEKSPRRRYASASALAEDLRRFLAHEPILARPVGPIGRTLRWCRRRPLVASLIALSSALAVALFVTVLVYDFRLQEALAQVQAKAEQEREDIVHLDVTIGLKEMENGDTLSAVLYFTEALRRDPGDRVHERNHRMRIAAALAQSPELLRVTLREAPLPQTGSPRMPADRVTASGEDGRFVLSVSPSGVGSVQNKETGKTIGLPLKADGVVTLGAVSKDGRRVAVVTRENSIRVGDSATGKWLGERIHCPFQVDYVVVSADGVRLLAAGRDRGALLWNWVNGDPAVSLSSGDDAIVHGRFSSDGNLLVTAQGVRGARVWSANTGRAITPYLRHGGPALAATFSEDRRLVLVETRDAVCSWRLPEKTVSLVQDAPERINEAVVTSEVADPSTEYRRLLGKKATTGEGLNLEIRKTEGGVRVFNSETGKPHGPVLEHSVPVRFACFDPEGALLATADVAGAVRVWDSLSGELIVPATPMVRPILGIDELTVTCGDGRQYRWAPGQVTEAVDFLTTHAHILANGWLDESQRRQSYDLKQLSAEWDAFEKAGHPAN